MLRDGEFLREPPVKIGAFYVPPIKHDATYEDMFIQEVLLQKHSQKRMIHSVTNVVYSIIKGLKKQSWA